MKLKRLKGGRKKSEVFTREPTLVSLFGGTCHFQGMAAVNISEIIIFAVLQHSHLLGRAIKTRHFRNSTELPPLMDEPHYDFNFQELTMLPKQRVVKPVSLGDLIIVNIMMMAFSL